METISNAARSTFKAARTTRRPGSDKPALRTLGGRTAKRVSMPTGKTDPRKALLLNEMIDQHFGGSIVRFARQALRGQKLSATEAKALVDMIQ